MRLEEFDGKKGDEEVRRRFLQQYIRKFQVVRGREVLEALEEKFLLQPVMWSSSHNNNNNNNNNIQPLHQELLQEKSAWGTSDDIFNHCKN